MRSGMRRGPLALAMGLTIAVLLLGAQYSHFLHAITNNGAGVTYTDAHPKLLTIWLTMSLPGLAMMLLAINVTPVTWALTRCWRICWLRRVTSFSTASPRVCCCD